MTEAAPTEADEGADAAARPRYHHGDLRAALLRAAEAELAEKGIESFSLRAVAKRAGVSHAAPAHHFGDVTGLLTALAAEGFRQFLAAQHAREAVAAPDPAAQLIAAGLGYIDFARARPALFRLIFSSGRPDFSEPDLCAQSDAAFGHLVAQVGAIAGVDPWRDRAAMQEVAAVWALVHGLADLLVSDRMKPVSGLSDAERDGVIEAMVRRLLPERRVSGAGDATPR